MISHQRQMWFPDSVKNDNDSRLIVWFVSQDRGKFSLFNCVFLEEKNRSNNDETREATWKSDTSTTDESSSLDFSSTVRRSSDLLFRHSSLFVHRHVRIRARVVAAWCTVEENPLFSCCSCAVAQYCGERAHSQNRHLMWHVTSDTCDVHRRMYICASTHIHGKYILLYIGEGHVRKVRDIPRSLVFTGACKHLHLGWEPRRS